MPYKQKLSDKTPQPLPTGNAMVTAYRNVKDAIANKYEPHVIDGFFQTFVEIMGQEPVSPWGEIAIDALHAYYNERKKPADSGCRPN